LLSLQPDNDARPTFLFGAGASFSSGIPPAAESVKRLAKQAYSDFQLGCKTLPEQIKTSDWTAWLQSHKWFIHGDDRLAENFPLVEHLLKPDAYRKRALLDLTALRQEIGPGYRASASCFCPCGKVQARQCFVKAMGGRRPDNSTQGLAYQLIVVAISYLGFKSGSPGPSPCLSTAVPPQSRNGTRMSCGWMGGRSTTSRRRPRNSGIPDRMIALTDQCLSEYDDGWSGGIRRLIPLMSCMGRPPPPRTAE
jgi:hypothetical protein